MDVQLVKLAKEKIINFLANDVEKGEPMDKIRVVNINWEDAEQTECIYQLINEGFITETEDRSICLISQEFYQRCKGGEQQ